MRAYLDHPSFIIQNDYLSEIESLLDQFLSTKNKICYSLCERISIGTIMAKEQAAQSPPDISATLPPTSRREALLDALTVHTTNPTHVRLITAYWASGTVAGAEQEFTNIIDEILNEA
jgi:hypothetical protein